MMDIIEMTESTAEDRYYEMLQPDGTLKCSCGRTFAEGEGEVLTDNPYGMPSCPTCFEEFMEEYGVEIQNDE